MRGTFAVALRILSGLKGDRATLAFVVGTPILILFLFGQVLDAVPPGRFDVDFIKPVLLAIFLFTLTYVLTGIGFLRERQTGTLERVLASPLPSTSLVAGYVLGFGVLAILQASVMLGAGVLFLDISFEHGVLAFYGVEVLTALVALGLGILISLLAQSEFQVVQGIPLVISPQLILGGVFVPVDALPAWLEWLARALPLTYILDAMDYVLRGEGSGGEMAIAVAVLSAYVVGSILLAGVVVRRRG